MSIILHIGKAAEDYRLTAVPFYSVNPWFPYNVLLKIIQKATDAV